MYDNLEERVADLKRRLDELEEAARRAGHQLLTVAESDTLAERVQKVRSAAGEIANVGKNKKSGD